MILDGFGHRKEKNDNAIAHANTPNLDQLYQDYPHGVISGSGEDVGLPAGQFGNSEVGHMNLGAGRIIYQESTRISKEIDSREFYQNPAIDVAIDKVKQAGGSVHVMGLLSDGGVHAHIDHIEAMCHSLVVHKVTKVYVHCFLDGRDTPPKSADKYIERFRRYLNGLNDHYGSQVQIASICGRFFAMDRDKRWDRVQQAYELLTEGKAERMATRADGAIQAAYKSRETDEFVSPTTVIEHGETPFTVNDHDAVFFMNFRADRARELSAAFLLSDREFSGFAREKCPKLSAFVMMTPYSDLLSSQPNVLVAYQPAKLTNSLGEYLQNQKKPNYALPKPKNTPMSLSFLVGVVNKSMKVRHAF